MAEIFKTSHRTFRVRYCFPTVVVDGDVRLPKPVPSILWHGKARKGSEELSLSEEVYFLFGLNIDVEDYRWHYFDRDGMHGHFKVVFVGKLKDWPCDNAVPDIAEELDANLEEYVVLLTCGEVIVPETLGPSTFAAKITLLADHGGVVIEPKKFQNLEVLNEEIEKVRKSLVLLYDDDDLPAG